MPRKKVIISTGETYHVYNRSIAKETIFPHKYDYERFLKLVDFYRFSETGIRFSYYNRLEQKLKSKFLKSLYDSPTQANILSFAIMSNHYHFLIQQTEDEGVKYLISKIQNGYAKYYNTRYERSGAVFQSPFKARWIEDEQQLFHVSRYIHLNPLTSYILKESYELDHYKYTSYPDYISDNSRKFVSNEMILSSFKNQNNYKDFCLDNADYQRTLKEIKV